MKRVTTIIILALTLVSCSSTTTDVFWVDQYGGSVPIMVTTIRQDTIYDFGTIIMYEDTTYADTLKH
jgi:PBP1b-binding outer membrane lipoprotein LpoB